MSGYRFSAIFCESVRMENSGQETIVGIFPDNIEVAQFPAVIPTVATYCRISFDPNLPPSSISVRLVDPEGQNLFINDVDSSLIKMAVAGAAASNLPLSTIITRAGVSPFPATKPGQYRLLIRVDSNEAIGGLLNMKLAPVAGAKGTP